MLSNEPADFTRIFVENLNNFLKEFKPEAVMTRIQMIWLSLCLTGILLTNSIFHKTHKQKDKATGGYVNGQTIILLLLVTGTLTIPVGFVFYQPEQARNPDYPAKLELALHLLSLKWKACWILSSQYCRIKIQARNLKKLQNLSRMFLSWFHQANI
ncbi:Uncharacterized protein dnl_27740 [Desulfonema limicola]|uniref:Uncharacterized protein n=1 Tax=Desulfonema limicola TaxID=45656 RepID=A0A975B825_9BACT|nr:hypothetical protein [Desulfonema limicola]QTA80469.1 Uncharacterized protein dnl_27740 [Desulfonema limicola]